MDTLNEVIFSQTTGANTSRVSALALRCPGKTYPLLLSISLAWKKPQSFYPVFALGSAVLSLLPPPDIDDEARQRTQERHKQHRQRPHRARHVRQRAATDCRRGVAMQRLHKRGWSSQPVSFNPVFTRQPASARPARGASPQRRRMLPGSPLTLTPPPSIASISGPKICAYVCANHSILILPMGSAGRTGSTPDLEPAGRCAFPSGPSPASTTLAAVRRNTAAAETAET